MLRSFTARHVGLRRSRLGSFRKDLIWRSWFRYGGLGEAGEYSRDVVRFDSVSQGGQGSMRRFMVRPVEISKGGSCCGGLGSIRSVWARHVAVRYVAETKGGGLCRSLTILKINIRKDYGR